jgi:uncharacterized protein involved in exopolysaccharide biosynthesis
MQTRDVAIILVAIATIWAAILCVAVWYLITQTPTLETATQILHLDQGSRNQNNPIHTSTRASEEGIELQTRTATRTNQGTV